MSDLVTVEELYEQLRSADPRRLAELVGASKGVNQCFIPSPGPQTVAYYSPADLTLFGGMASGGKGFRKQQLILTPFGWRRLGDLKVGSAICATDGTVQRIIGYHERGVQPLYKLTWSDGTETVCDSDHIWLGWWSNAIKKIANKKTHGESAAQKWVTKDIFNQFNDNRENRKRLNRFGIPVMSAPCAFNVHGENKGPKKHISRIIPPYVLGVLLGDGCLTKNSVEFCSADIEIPDKVEALLKERFGEDAYISPRKSDGICVTYGIPKALCYSHLVDLGVMGHGAATKFIPRIYLLASVDERWELLRGLMDTDGWADLDGDIYFCTISEQLRDDVKHLVRSLGGIVTHTVKSPTYTGKDGKKINGKMAYALRIKLSQPDNAFSLERKKVKCRGRRHNSMGLWLENIEPFGEAETVCITVSHRNSLFVTEQFLVTHNSALLVGMALTAHLRSLIMRPQYTELTDLIDKMIKFYGTRDGFSGSSPPSMKTKDGRFIQFGACANPGDEFNWQGQEHDLKCVGRDTPVLMADGSYKAIQDVVVGDMVQTLNGARKVTRVLPVRHDEAVSVTINGVTQVQSMTHEILTSRGWISAGDLIAACEPTLFRSFCKFSGLSVLRSWLNFLRHKSRNSYLAQKIKQFRLFVGRQYSRVSDAFYAVSSQGTDCVSSDGVSRVGLPRSLSKESQGFLQGRIYPRPSGLYRHFSSRGATCGRSSSLLLGYLKSCLCVFRFYGVRILQSLGLSTSVICARLYLPQSGGAGKPIPTYFAGVGTALAGIQKYILRSRRYLHPYTKGICYSLTSLGISEPLRVTPIGKVDLYDIEVEELNHYITNSGIVNKNCFDEVVNFREDQVRFIMTWNRTDTPGQRVRTVFASNPPVSTQGDWIIGMFRPWLDPTHPNPAKDGELRWFVTDKDGKDVEVADSNPIEDGYKPDGTKRMIIPKSRTFIRSSIDDNPYADPNYKATLDAMKEPYRSAMRDGNFMMARKDSENQLIPTAWVREAQNRWTEQPPAGVPMCAIGVDPAGGGDDETVLAPRYDGYYPEFIVIPGKETPYPQDVAAKVMRYRRDEALPIVDCGGGYGGGVVRHLEDNGIKAKAHKGAEKSAKRSKDRLYAFANKRAEVYWRFMEALDPSQDGGSTIALPPDQKLMSDLCSVNFSITSRGVTLESKDDMKKRLGRSPDRADAVVIAWSHGDSIIHKKDGKWERGGTRSFPKAILGHMAQRRLR